MTAFQRIYAVLTPSERRAALSLFGLTAVGMLLETLSIGLVIPAIALLMQNVETAPPGLQVVLMRLLGYPSQNRLITLGLLTLVAIYFVKNVFLAYYSWRQHRFTNEVKAELSQRLFTIYLRQPYAFHLERNSSQLMRNVLGEASTFTGTLTHAVNFLTETLVLLGVAVLLMLVEPVGVAIVVVGLGSASLVFHLVLRYHVARWGKARHYHEGLLLQHLQQGLGGAKDVKLLGREEDFLAQFQVHNLQSTRAMMFQATFTQLPRFWLELLAVAGLATLVISMLAQGRTMVSIVPTLGLFAAAAFRVMPSVVKILGAAQALRYGLPAIETLYVEVQRPAPPPRAAAGPLRPLEHQITLSGVTFTYHGAPRPALDHVSLEIKKGETVGFVGSSGAGKSTLVDVTLGLLTPGAGEVAIDGRDIQLDLRAWQNQIGYVPQSIYLTDDSLRRNVAFGVPASEIDEAAVVRAIRAAQLEGFVASLPDGLQTMVGERGVRLSGGQRQRIGIARALYHDPSVLVLDEATSALDTATEREVMQAVIALHHSKTILIVAHRLSTVEHCDRVFRLEHGSIAGQPMPGHSIR